MDLSELAKIISSTMEPLAALKDSIQNNVAPALLSFAQATKRISDSVHFKMDEYRPAILSTLKGLATITQIYDAAEKLGKRQFILVSHIPPELVERSAAGEDSDELASEYLVNDDLITATADLCGMQDSPLLQQSIKALFDGSYNLSILGLMAQLDRALSEQSGMIRKVNFRQRYEKIYNRINERGDIYLDDMEGRDFLTFLTYHEAIDGIGDDKGFDKEEPKTVNRNWIIHGRTGKIYTRLECVKALNMIYGTIRLGELGREDAIDSRDDTQKNGFVKLDSIHHIAIICSDKNKSIEFYSNKLGFSVIRENYRPDRNDWKIDLRLNKSIELELFIIPSAPPRPSYPEAQGLRHLAFRVPSVADAVAWLNERGIQCESVRRDSYTGAAMTFFHDPDGLPIEIHE